LLEAETFVKIDGSFNYLLNLPIASLTLKHAKKHEQDLADLRGEIAALEKTTAKQMWFKELSILKV
jgi:DNA topoisomerase-2